MPIINGPPPAQELLVDLSCPQKISSEYPWLAMTDIVYHIDAALKVSVRGHILIVPARRAIVRKTQPFPFTKVHIQETLVRPVKADPSIRQGKQSIVVSHVRLQGEHPAVEAIRPADIWSSCKRRGLLKELVRCPQSHHVCVKVDDMLKLCQPP